MSMTRAQRLAALVQANIGAIINHTVTKDGKEVVRQLKLVALDTEKTTKMKDNSQGAYVVLHDLSVEGAEPKVVKLNPQTIDKLFKNTRESGLELVDGINTPQEVAEADAEAQLAAEQEKAAHKAAQEVAKAEKDAKRKAEAAERREAKGPTKASQAAEIYASMTAAGKERKDIIAAFKTQLLMSDNGAATYYQNCKAKAAKPASAE